MNFNKIGGFPGGEKLESVDKLQQQLPQDSMSSIIDINNPRNWELDFPHENGNYYNMCINCKQGFIGHKRRVICKICSLSEIPLEEIK